MCECVYTQTHTHTRVQQYTRAYNGDNLSHVKHSYGNYFVAGDGSCRV